MIEKSRLELDILKSQYKDAFRPKNWNLSPEAILLFILGGKLKDGTVISPKYFGEKALVEVMIATLMSDRALLLIGVPGTAKTWIADHITTALSGDAALLVQGTSGTNEESLRYGWNYAQLLANGPSETALVKSPIYRAMETGRIARIEELTRIPSEIQDALISILSEKTISIPELNSSIKAERGFNIIATANHLDRGVYELSSALRRRFNIVLLPLPKTKEEEVKIVQHRAAQLEEAFDYKFPDIKQNHIDKLITLFREMRNGQTEDGKQKFKQSTSTLSPAEAISIVHQAQIQAAMFDHDTISPKHFTQGIIQAIGHSPEEILLLKDYNENIVKKRNDWSEWYQSFKSASLD